MKKAPLKIRKGLTLIEVMVAAAVIIVAIIGAMTFRYFCALDARKSSVQTTAGRLGQLLLEGWSGLGGRAVTDPYNIFNPASFSTAASELLVVADVGPSVPDGFNSFGSFRVTADGAYYYATLSYQDDAANGLRILNVSVAWPEKYPVGAFSSDDRAVNFTTKINLSGG
jgi:hypothetical protein